ncbi:MAG: 6,7-dimethyl-8-ribityllumazine synthase [Alphaproteobacteria bacterium]|nr:6,7-dimethyl-8-ribityllumazine synthase [Alphaproteobacteria bacterium]
MSAAETEKPIHVLIAEGRFYDDIADELLKGTEAVLGENGATFERIVVPGAFEIPAAIALGAETGRFDGFIALGCVIRGETTHYDYICGESARGLMDLSVQRRLAIGYGILTTETHDQALERARVDRKNKGADAARACLAMVSLQRTLAAGP